MYAKKLLDAKKYLFVALYIDVFAILVGLGCNIYLSRIFIDVKQGRIAIDQALLDRVDLVEYFSKFALLTLLGVGFALVHWLNACYKYAKYERGLVGFKNENWTAAGWIIPLFNLVKPYQIINEIYKAGSSKSNDPEGWKKESGSVLLLLWWIFWAISHVIFSIAGKAVFKASMQENIDIEKATNIYVSHSLLLGGSVVISILWFWVSGKLTRRLMSGGEKTIISRSITTSRLIAQDNEGYAEALNEIEEGRLDKGLWARAFADAGGESEKAKALYIKARAGVLKVGGVKNDQVWQVTQPAAADDTDTQGMGVGVVDGVNLPSTSRWPIRVVAGVAIAVVSAAFAVSLYQAHMAQRVAVGARTSTQPVEKARPEGGKDEISPSAKSVPELDSSGISAENEKQRKDHEAISKADADFNSAYSALERRAYGDAFNGFRSLALQGDSRGQVNLGSMYYNGNGVAKSYAEAVKWYRLAAAQGNSTAQSNLGAMYALGQGVKQNILLAHMWLNLSAAAGNLDAAEVRDTATEKVMTPQQIALAQQMARDCQQRNFKGCD